MLDAIYDGEAFVDAHRRAGQQTARILTGMYQRDARHAGVPRSMSRGLRVSYDHSDLGFDYSLPEELEGLEYGDLSHPPVAFRRKAMARHSEHATRLYDQLVDHHFNPAVL